MNKHDERHDHPHVSRSCPGRWGLRLGLALLLSLGALPTGVQAQEAGLFATLALSPQAVDGAGSTPVQATITVTYNLTSGGDVLARTGFSAEAWEFLLVFTGTDGQTVTSHVATTGQGEEDGPPTIVRVTGNDGVVRKIYVQGIESLNSTFTRTVVLPDVRTVYELGVGAYTAQVVIPFQRFAVVFDVVEGVPVAQSNAAIFEGVLASNVVPLDILVDGDSDGWTVPDANQGGPVPIAVDCNDGNAAINPGATEIPGNGVDDDCNAATSDVVGVTPATVTIAVEDKNKAPVVGFPVRLFDRTSACVQQFGTAPQHFASIWLSSCPGPGDGLTDAAGEVVLQVPPGAYLAIGEHTPGGGGPVEYVGKNVGDVVAGESITKTIKLK